MKTFHINNPEGKNTVATIGQAVVTVPFLVYYDQGLDHQDGDPPALVIKPQTAAITVVTGDDGTPHTAPWGGGKTPSWAWAGYDDLAEGAPPYDPAVGFRISLSTLVTKGLEASDGRTIPWIANGKEVGFLRLQGWMARPTADGPRLVRFHSDWNGGPHSRFWHLPHRIDGDLATLTLGRAPGGVVAQEVDIFEGTLAEVMAVRAFLFTQPSVVLEDIWAVASGRNPEDPPDDIFDDVDGIDQWEEGPSVSDLNPGLTKRSRNRMK